MTIEECPPNATETVDIKQMTKSARKNKKRKATKSTDKESEYLSKTETIPVTNAVAGSNIRHSCNAGYNSQILATNPEIDISLRKLNAKLASIQTLKCQQNEGKQLEKNQIEKIGRENDIILEIQKLEKRKNL